MNYKLHRKRLYSVLSYCCLAGTLGIGSSQSVQAQVSRQRSISGEGKAEQLSREQTETKKGFLLSLEKWNIGIRPRVDLEYNSNVYRNSKVDDSDDIIIRPEVKFDFNRAVSDFNSIDLTLGIGTDLYTKHTDINTYAPIISPDTEFAYHAFIGDTHLKLREAFSYQEDINTYTTEIPEYMDVDTIRFGRYDNLLGGALDWDTGAFLFTGTFDWEWFHSNTSRYSYMDRNSGLFTQSASYFIKPTMQVGIELADPIHCYEEDRINNQFRMNAGPFFAMKLGDHVSFRVGGGYNYATFYANEDDVVTEDINDWYAYGSVQYEITPWLIESLSVRRDNRLSWNSDNQENLSIFDSIRFTYIRDFNMEFYGSAFFYKDNGIQYLNRNDAEATYYSGGMRIAYTGWKRWEPSLRYTYYTYDRDNATYSTASYDVHQVMLGVQYTF